MVAGVADIPAEVKGDPENEDDDEEGRRCLTGTKTDEEHGIDGGGL